jgi:hypothetical protein
MELYFLLSFVGSCSAKSCSQMDLQMILFFEVVYRSMQLSI